MPTRSTRSSVASREIHEDARIRGNRGLFGPRWPMIVLESPKAGPDPKRSRAAHRGHLQSHQVPLTDPRNNPAHLRLLESWLRSYRPQELFDTHGRLRMELRALAPRGRAPHEPIHTPTAACCFTTCGCLTSDRRSRGCPAPGAVEAEDTRVLGRYLRDVIRSERDAQELSHLRAR